MCISSAPKQTKLPQRGTTPAATHNMRGHQAANNKPRLPQPTLRYTGLFTLYPFRVMQKALSINCACDQSLQATSKGVAAYLPSKSRISSS